MVTTHFMDSEFLKKQLIGEIEEVVRVKQLNVDLLEHLTYTARWILIYCEKNNIKPPDMNKLLELISKSRELVQRMTESYSASTLCSDC